MQVLLIVLRWEQFLKGYNSIFVLIVRNTEANIPRQPVTRPIPLPVIPPPPARMIRKEEIMRPPVIESDNTSVQGTPMMNIARKQFFEKNSNPRTTNVQHSK